MVKYCSKSQRYQIMTGAIENLSEKIISVAKKRTLESITRIDGGIIQEDGTVKDGQVVATASVTEQKTE